MSDQANNRYNNSRDNNSNTGFRSGGNGRGGDNSRGNSTSRGGSGFRGRGRGRGRGGRGNDNYRPQNPRYVPKSERNDNRPALTPEEKEEKAQALNAVWQQCLNEVCLPKSYLTEQYDERSNLIDPVSHLPYTSMMVSLSKMLQINKHTNTTPTPEYLQALQQKVQQKAQQEQKASDDNSVETLSSNEDGDNNENTAEPTVAADPAPAVVEQVVAPAENDNNIYYGKYKFDRTRVYNNPEFKKKMIEYYKPLDYYCNINYNNYRKEWTLTLKWHN